MISENGLRFYFKASLKKAGTRLTTIAFFSRQIARTDSHEVVAWALFDSVHTQSTFCNYPAQSALPSTGCNSPVRHEKKK
jgi:hypothetical protein